jgi:hypothetical protein
MRAAACLLAAVMLCGGPAAAQSLPGGLSAGQALMLYQALTPQQRQMLAVGALRGTDSLSAADALAWYQSMTPQQKEQAKALAAQQGSNASGLKDMAKGLLGR